MSASLLMPMTSAVAQNLPDQNPNKYPGWVVGLGYVGAPDPFVGNANDASQFFPIVGYIGERLTWLGPFAEYKLVGDEALAISAVVEVDFDGFESDSQEPLLLGLSERKSALLAGVDIDYGLLSLSGRTDVSSRHSGSSFGLSISQGWEIADRFELVGDIGAEWQSSDIVDYYYGVTVQEATSARPANLPGSATNFGVGLELTYQLNDRSVLIFGADTKRLDNEIVASPIVDDQYELSAYIGYVYQLFDSSRR